MKIKRIFLLAILALAGAVSCGKQVDPEPSEEAKTRLYANTFARNYMQIYYLWNKEVGKDLEAWKDSEDPISKVEKVRYKDASGKDIDRWTMCTDDFESFYGSVSGNGKTYGFDFVLYYLDSSHSALCAVVTYTYPGGPAEQAGLKRGDAIFKVNGRTIPAKDYASTVSELMGGDRLTAELYDGRTVTLEAREMYENPVLLDKVFDLGGKRIGYLVYTSFTLDSYRELIDACTRFKEAGVKELILDLRYNGGGFSAAEEFLASLLAPEAVVKAGEVLSTEVFNADLTDYYATQEDFDANTYFRTEFEIEASDGKKNAFSTAGANPDLDKLYCIITSGSASASEALICDLYPYMDVTLVGEKSHGKYCAGLMLRAESYYKSYADQLGEEFATEGKQFTRNWGMYLMYSRFADKDGVTRCMPDGLTPDVVADDDPADGIPLGDPAEVMLARTLSLCGYTPAPQAARRSAPVPAREKAEAQPLRPGFGMMIKEF